MAAATSAAWTLCLLVLLSGGGSGGGGVAAQQLTPFQGRNTPPEGGLDVYISPVVDHLISVNDVEYKFQARQSQRHLALPVPCLPACMCLPVTLQVGIGEFTSESKVLRLLAHRRSCTSC
jgi:hypothetical protein